MNIKLIELKKILIKLNIKSLTLYQKLEKATQELSSNTIDNSKSLKRLHVKFALLQYLLKKTLTKSKKIFDQFSEKYNIPRELLNDILSSPIKNNQNFSFPDQNQSLHPNNNVSNTNLLPTYSKWFSTTNNKNQTSKNTIIISAQTQQTKITNFLKDDSQKEMNKLFAHIPNTKNISLATEIQDDFQHDPNKKIPLLRYGNQNIIDKLFSHIPSEKNVSSKKDIQEESNPNNNALEQVIISIFERSIQPSHKEML